MQKLNISANHDFYSYAVLNCGGTTANAERHLRGAYPVKAVFSLVTVENYTPMYKVVSEDNIIKRLDKADRDIGAIIGHIEKKDKGSFDKCKGIFPNLLTFIAYPLYKHGRKTKKFTVSANCSYCRLCEKVCPRGIIRIEGEKPTWKQTKCELCLACLHRCPKSAINYGKKTAEHGRYTNPRVKL